MFFGKCTFQININLVVSITRLCSLLSENFPGCQKMAKTDIIRFESLPSPLPLQAGLWYGFVLSYWVSGIWYGARRAEAPIHSCSGGVSHTLSPDTGMGCSIPTTLHQRCENTVLYFILLLSSIAGGCNVVLSRIRNQMSSCVTDVTCLFSVYIVMENQ